MSSDFGAKPDSESQSEVKDMPRSGETKDTEVKENVNCETTDIMPDSDKSKTQPEPIQGGKDMPRIPPIGMNELESILKGPNMPSQKLMKEVTEKIRMKNDESGSDDGSVTSAGGSGVGIRGILDCILEASLFHQDSEDESEGEGDEIFVRELPCQYCKKIFGSTMNLNTHVLMTHSQEDPSVLNVRNQSRDAGRREKLSPTGRTKSTEGRDKEVAARSLRRQSSGRKESAVVATDDVTLKNRQVRSRHNSKEQSTKTSDKHRELLDASLATAVTSTKTTNVSSQKTQIQSISNVKTKEESGEMCDLKSSETSQQVSYSHQPEDSLQISSSSPPPSSSSSKATKRKSKVTDSSDLSTASKKVKRSQSQSGEGKTKCGVQLRRSSRRK